MTMEKECLDYKASMEFEIWINEHINDITNDFEITQMITEEKGEENNESGFQKVAKRLSKMLGRLIDKLLTFADKMASAIKKKTETAKFKLAIKRIKLIKSSKPIKFIDVWELEKEIKAESRELSVLCNAWVASYEKHGKGPTAATIFESQFKKIVEKHETKIEEIKKEKKEFPANKVRDWLLKNVRKDGEFQGLLRVYAKTIEKNKKILDDVQERKAMFIDRTGYDDGPITVSRVVNNSCNYVKRNADWLGMYWLSSVFLIGSQVAKAYDLANQEEELDGVVDMSDEFEGEQTKRIIANTNWKDPEYKSSLKTTHDRLMTLSGMMGGGAAAIQLKENRKRNSI